jgi:hypothetical protein
MVNIDFKPMIWNILPSGRSAGNQIGVFRTTNPNYNGGMVVLPQQDWRAYQSRAQASEAAWLRGLSAADRFVLYADLFTIVWDAGRRRGDWERLERWSWQQKLALRRRLVEAYRMRDQLLHERAAQNNAG